jgi:hypothetical protein
MHFLFNLLRINASTCFENYLLILRRCYTSGTWYIAFHFGTLTLVQPTDITRMQYTKCRLWSASWGWASNARNMYRLLIPKFPNWIKSASRWFHYTDILWCTVSKTLSLTTEVMNHEGVEVIKLMLHNIIFVAFNSAEREVVSQTTDKILVSFTNNEQGFWFTLTSTITSCRLANRYKRL